jgi:hypothetical protein
MATTSPYTTGIRSALNNKGVDNSRVGYKDGFVTVDGKNFLKADLNNKGTTYTSQANFDKAYGGLNLGNQPTASPVSPASVSPMAQAAANVTGKQAVYTPPTSQATQTLGKIGTGIDQSAGFQFTTPEAFSYNAESDPAYQSQLALAKQNAADQQIDTNAMLRASGQGKSSYSETVANQIGNKAMSTLSDTIIPQLMQQAYQRYTDDANRNLQTQQLNYGVSQDQLSNLSSLYGLQNQEYFQNPLIESETTGNYLPEEAKAAISNLMGLKGQAETKGVTAAERADYSKQADAIRSYLDSIGIDSTKYGANVSAAQASQVTPGIRTLQGQQLDQQNEQQQWENRFNYGQATGQFSNGQKTLQAQQMDTANSQYAEQFAYQKARDAITDQRWQTEFDENVRQYGLGYGLQQLSQSSDSAYRQAQLALSQDDNYRAWAQLDYDQSQPSASKYVGMTANQVLDNIKSLYTEPVYVQDPDYPKDSTKKIKSGEQLTKDPAKRTEMFEAVADAGLSEAETKQVLISLGYNMKEIESRVKQYPN